MLELRLTNDRLRSHRRQLLDSASERWATLEYDPPATKATTFTFDAEHPWSATQSGGFHNFVVASTTQTLGTVRYRRWRSLMRGRVSWEVCGPDGAPITVLHAEAAWGAVGEMARAARGRPMYSYAGVLDDGNMVQAAARFRQDASIAVAEPHRLLATAAVLAVVLHPSAD